MENLYNITAIRDVERAILARENSYNLMSRAGEAIARHAREMTNGPICVLAGPGNNGGDAFIAAALLKKKGMSVNVVFVGDEERLPPDAKRAHAEWCKHGGEMIDYLPDGEVLVIDGLLGVGLHRKTEDKMASLIRNSTGALSIDVPSGIHADTGAAMGDAVMAARTVTFFAPKPGLFTGDGLVAAGEVRVEDLNGSDDLPQPSGMLINSAEGLGFSKLQRTKNSHKGTSGTAVIVGGDEGMLGALMLASRAAVRLGAGKVYALSVADNSLPCDVLCPEVMWHRAKQLSNFSDASCIAIGPGLGEHAEVVSLAVESDVPLVVDADALNILAKDASLSVRLARREAPTILTPHPGEAARLLDCKTSEINESRIQSAQELAEKYHAIVVLKGAGSIIADSDGWTICGAGNPSLAQAGAGDVLTGIIAALVAQTGDVKFAANAGVWLHAAAADKIANGKIGLDINAIPAIAVTMANRQIS